MRNLEYNKQSYRLSEEVAKRIKEGKERSGLSYNLFFKALLDGLINEGGTQVPEETSQSEAEENTEDGK
jgi:hypothetical protein